MSNNSNKGIPPKVSMGSNLNNKRKPSNSNGKNSSDRTKSTTGKSQDDNNGKIPPGVSIVKSSFANKVPHKGNPRQGYISEFIPGLAELNKIREEELKAEKEADKWLLDNGDNADKLTRSLKSEKESLYRDQEVSKERESTEKANVSDSLDEELSPEEEKQISEIANDIFKGLDSKEQAKYDARAAEQIRDEGSNPSPTPENIREKALRLFEDNIAKALSGKNQTFSQLKHLDAKMAKKFIKGFQKRNKIVKNFKNLGVDLTTKKGRATFAKIAERSGLNKSESGLIVDIANVKKLDNKEIMSIMKKMDTAKEFSQVTKNINNMGDRVKNSYDEYGNKNPFLNNFSRRTGGGIGC